MPPQVQRKYNILLSIIYVLLNIKYIINIIIAISEIGRFALSDLTMYPETMGWRELKHPDLLPLY